MFKEIDFWQPIENFDHLENDIQGVISFCGGAEQIDDYSIAQMAHRIILQCKPEVIKELTLDWYARRVGVSSSHVCSVLKRYFGRTFGHYLMRRKLMIAKDLLINHPRLSIDQIADKLGYCTGNYFIKVFKKECGVTPHQYRKQLQLIPQLKGPIKKLAEELEFLINNEVHTASNSTILNAVTIHGGATKRKPRKRVKFPG